MNEGAGDPNEWIRASAYEASNDIRIFIPELTPELVLHSDGSEPYDDD